MRIRTREDLPIVASSIREDRKSGVDPSSSLPWTRYMDLRHQSARSNQRNSDTKPFVRLCTMRPRENEMTPSVYKNRAKEAFDRVDTESAGSLTKQQCKIATTAVFGYCPDKAEMKQMFQTIDRISRKEFERWISRKCPANDSHVNKETLFALLDETCKGYLTLEDFCSASKFVDLNVSTSVWKMVFKEMDRYKRGYIDFDEFSHVLSTE
ncbi:EF-hand calcium-binding domain-containing protein 11-like [Hylaeus anthracinus]|uniref:EF-hand calcium-binding domain-containing protein 11-like n=1 Tax=Hylaeus anthracinus TaxID=313031 RepID=UPI0023B8F2AB|nr:EF-hand calcium-binding domain-containing protein 11-like [Hylaeus anthracinus]